MAMFIKFMGTSIIILIILIKSLTQSLSFHSVV